MFAWCVLATDGAQRGIDKLAIAWNQVAQKTTDQLQAMLQDLQHWEVDDDPAGLQLPRAKCHDDKTIVVWTRANSTDHMQRPVIT